MKKGIIVGGCLVLVLLLLGLFGKSMLQSLAPEIKDVTHVSGTAVYDKAYERLTFVMENHLMVPIHFDSVFVDSYADGQKVVTIRRERDFRLGALATDTVSYEATIDQQDLLDILQEAEANDQDSIDLHHTGVLYYHLLGTSLEIPIDVTTKIKAYRLPKFRVKEVTWDRFLALKGDLHLNVWNRTEFAFTVQRVDLHIRVQDNALETDIRKEVDFSIPAHDSTDVTVPFDFDINLLKTLGEVVKEGLRWEYELQGEVEIVVPRHDGEPGDTIPIDLYTKDRLPPLVGKK
ncbi:hypothetical protein SAMN05421823_104107 [Catalinimonas alkaloidigena]|uniref:Late embryogenesis abundant protein LEA-2 subgroup domain-containing protein n=1 Tax=Catalinimonas alkaloidigena TaxID=1075417 RepID=A0A1G9GH98_9BACT|nr:LEA type 2 family protein [Catalinimonas alkaloidigena]SDL00058.1 hypothetical protein SAMN05421823_104107 [Catalinimonas alkaloidigena]